MNTHTTTTNTRFTLKEILEMLVVTLLLTGVALTLFAPAHVRGTSMNPTFYTGDHLLVERVSPRLNAISVGDVVIFASGDEHLIKRVIATSGDTVTIQDGDVYVNGVFVATGAHLVNAKVTLHDAVFVLGDNRNSSNDSRNFGIVPMAHVEGRVVARLWR